MGDEIYPGFVLSNVTSGVTEDQVRELLELRMGNFKTRNDKGPRITILQNSGGGNHVIVEGVMEQFGKISHTLHTEELNGAYVYKIYPYFGFELNFDGLFVGENVHQELHSHLLEGRGKFQFPLNVLERHFTQRGLGGMEYPTNCLFINVPTRYINRKVLGNYAKYELQFGPAKWDQLRAPGKRNLTKITYHYRLDAIRDLCRLNGSNLLTGRRRQFLVPVDPNQEQTTTYVECLVQPTEILSKSYHVKFLREVMREEGYVHRARLNPYIIDFRLLDNLQSECINCCEKFQIIGIDADLNWVAGVCQCTDNMRIKWREKDSFTRLTLPKSGKKAFNQYDDEDNLEFELHPIIPGLCPYYESVDDFKRRAVQAAKLEWQYNKKNMIIKKTIIGKLLTSEDLETVMVTNQRRRRVKVEIEVPRNDFWNQENVAKIAYISLQVITPSDPTPPQFTYAALRTTKIPGKLFSIENVRGDSKCIVTSVVLIPTYETIPPKADVVVSPRPPKAEYESLRDITDHWGDYYASSKKKKSKGEIVDIRHSLLHYNTTDIDSSHDYTIIDLKVKFNNEFFNLRNELENRVYIGVIVDLNGEVNGREKRFKVEGRVMEIVRVVQVNDKKKKTLNFLQLKVAIRMRKGVTVTKTQNVKCEFWCAVRFNREAKDTFLLPSTSKELAVTADGGDDDDQAFQMIDDEVKFFRGADLYGEVERKEDDPEPYQGYYRRVCRVKDNPFIPSCFKFWLKLLPKRREDGSHPPFNAFSFENLESLDKDWQYCPHVTDYAMLDFLLHPDLPLVDQTHKAYLCGPRTEEKYVRIKREIKSRLNEWQYAAVKKLRRGRLSIINGPPGSGKSSCLAYGVASLYCEEEGLIVVTSFSNEATNVVYEKIMQVKGILNLTDMKVMRVYATSKEDMVYGNDPNVLHHAMKQRGEWNDPDMKDLFERRNSVGPASLKLEEMHRYKNHARDVQVKMMSECDVLVMTLGCSCDFRLETTARLLAQRGRRIGALFVDEASLTKVPNLVTALVVGPERVILVGDRRQLSPSVSSHSAKFAGLDISWLEFLELTRYGRRADVFTQLNIQYRMHPDICRIVSSLTYKGALIPDQSLRGRSIWHFDRALRSLPGLSRETRMVAYTYQNRNEEMKINTSIGNSMEVNIIRSLLHKLHDGGVDMRRVSVIAMYSEQVSKIGFMLRNLGGGFERVQFGTVDSFQGKDNDFVIVSLVRSNSRRKIGFLAEQRRFNVAISRARHFNVIVGDFKLLREIEIKFMRDFLGLLGGNLYDMRVLGN